MQSSGGTLTPETAERRPAHLIESGPAAGVIACSYLGRLTGRRQLISLDMGGTTAKAAIVEDGLPVRTTEYEVGAGINLSSKLVKGGGHPIKLPFIDVSEIGAGGGSIVSIDPLGSVSVGPRSAGSDPGPACYGIGGDEPTLTDALLVLGYLGVAQLGGGAITLDPERARAALDRVVATPLGLSVEEAAHGILQLAVATMTRAVKAVTTYRGRDPRDFTLCAFGGNGPLTGVEVARALGMRRVLVPPAPGVFSALGLLFSDTEHEVVRTLMLRGHEITPRAPRVGVRGARDGSEGAPHPERQRARHRVAVRGRSLRGAGVRALRCRFRPARSTSRRLVADFVAEHDRTYGHGSADDPVDVVSVRALARLERTAAQRYDPLAAIQALPDARGLTSGLLRPRDGLRRHTRLQPRRPPRRAAAAGRCSSTSPTPRASSRRDGSRSSTTTATSRWSSMPDVDPITLEVVKNALASTADEMALVIMRSAYSPVVRDTLDYSTALCDRNGRIVAQGLTLAVQLGTFPTVMRHVLEELGPSAQPGDVYIANDPYGCGGQHLPDIYVIKPVFVDGVLEGYAATMAHHSDVGGIAPGSIAVHATEIYQEGLRIPLSKLVDAGVEDATLLRLLEANTRQPTHVLGDLRAQLAACRVGERGLTALVERYGADAHRYTDELQRVAERTMRAELAALPDGVRTFTDFIDGVGDESGPGSRSAFASRSRGTRRSWTSRERRRRSRRASTARSGWSTRRATAPSAASPGPRSRTARATWRRSMSTPRPARSSTRCCRPPAGPAVSSATGCTTRSWAPSRTLVPDRVIAAGEGGPTLVALGGYDRDRRPFGTTEVLVGSWGARAERDGLEGVSNPLANLGNQPVELIEADQPLRIERYGLVPDSGGAGRHRGGLAYVREYTVLAERATLTIRADRRDHPPYGLEGGEPGAPSANVVVSDGESRELPTMPMEADVLGTRRQLHARVRRRRRLRRRVRARSRRCAGGRPRRQGLGRRSARALRGRRRRRRGRLDVDRRAPARPERVVIDLAVRHGVVVDGTGAAERRADVGIDDGRIVAVGDVPEAGQEVDAAGKVVTPGFIDIHSHSDFTLLVDPRAASAVHQGVTLEVVGNCGFGCFPLLNKELAPKAIYGHSADVPLTWTSAAEYFERLEEARPAINVASLVPNGQLRLSVVGLADRPARADELARMRYLLDEALEQGAFGYSTGLEYAAERGADEDELVSMCEVCGRRHGLYATHTRRRDEGADEAVAEALRTAERSGVRLQVSHLVPRNGIESSRRCVELVEESASAGMDVAFDMHTRLYGTTFLLAALPPSALEEPARLEEILSERRGATEAPRLREHPQRRR